MIRMGLYMRFPEMQQWPIWMDGLLCVPIIFSGIFIGQKIGKRLSEPMMKKSIDVFLMIFILTLGFEIVKTILQQG